MQTQIKHSKYRNTGILFELLIRQIASDLMHAPESKAVDVLKKFFTKTELSKELNLYSAVLKASKLDEGKASMLISTIVEQSRQLNRDKLSKEKYNLIKEIKKHYNLDEFFKAKIKDYKVSAAIYTVLEAANAKSVTDTDQLVTNRVVILEHLTNPIDSLDQDPVMKQFASESRETKLLSYKFLIQKFNEEYLDFSPEQKEVLREYINSITETTKLREFINTKFEKIRNELVKEIKKVKDPVVKIKLQEVVKYVKPLSTRQRVKDEHLVSLMQYLELIKELKAVK